MSELLANTIVGSPEILIAALLVFGVLLVIAREPQKPKKQHGLDR